MVAAPAADIVHTVKMSVPDVSLLSSLTGALYRTVTDPLVAAGRAAYFSLLRSGLRRGRLTVCHEFVGVEGNCSYTFGDDSDAKSGYGDPTLQAQLTVKQPAFYRRLLLHAEMGFGEAFIAGDIKVDDLTALMKLFVINRETLRSAGTAVGRLLNRAGNSRIANSLANSLHNVSAHYDIGNELFTSFLDPTTMMYSSAVWSDAPGETLDTAQLRKIRMIISKARLSADDDVLEIGTGWGGFAIQAVQDTGCRVTTITLSREQKQYAEQRIVTLPNAVSSRIQVVLCDYRALPTYFAGRVFDKIVSIEMLEAVGPEFLATYFDVCNRMVHPRHGIMVFQCIAMPESRYEEYCTKVDFIQRYIFPGGHCPSVTALMTAITAGSDSQFIVDHLENIGPHYARTLRVWRDSFLANYDKLLRPFPKYVDDGSQASLWRLLTGITGVDTANEASFTPSASREPFYSDQFLRKWLYYFSYCEAGFATRTLANVQMVLTRERNEDLVREVASMARHVDSLFLAVKRKSCTPICLFRTTIV